MGWIRRILFRPSWKMSNEAFGTEHHAEPYGKETTKIGEERNDMMETVEVQEACLSAVFGLDGFKDYYRCLARDNLFKENRGDFGCKTNSISISPMLFIGNRGTGKSMAAEMLGSLRCSKVHEVQLSKLVVKDNTRETRENARMAMRRNTTMVVNGVQRLEKSSYRRYYDLVALQEMKELTSEYNINLIFTAPRGLSKKALDRILDIFGERMKVFECGDYSIKDLAQMVRVKMNDQGEKNPCRGLRLHPECTVGAISKLIKKKTSKKQRCMNGFLVDVILENARISLDARVGLRATGKELLTIRLQDLEKGLSSI